MPESQMLNLCSKFFPRSPRVLLEYPMLEPKKPVISVFSP